MERTKKGAESYLPPKRNLAHLKKAVHGCRGCELYKAATQAVFGEGPRTASMVFVGEQPGNEEDLKGRPFVGPSGKVLRKVLEQVGIDPAKIYITNAVKHFRFETRGKLRLHKKPSAAQITACRPWLNAEFEALKPKLIVCMGATAVQAVLGKSVSVIRDRGKVLTHEKGYQVLVTYHPSFILRALPDSRDRLLNEFRDDLKLAAKLMR